MNPGAAAIPFFKIFINIVEMEGLIEKIKPHSRKIVLFGSASRGEDTWDSDLDLLVITPLSDMVGELLRKEEVNRNISPIILSSVELARLREKDRAFFDEMEKGIILWRDKDE